MITLSMIVKDEEGYLEECLKSVHEAVDEIVIVDTGSTDKTKEIALKHDAKVYDFAWINDFSAARNFALYKSSGDWILYLDADERLNAKSVKELKKICSINKQKAFLCKIINQDNIHGRPSIMSYVRLFPRLDGVEFEGKIHEQIEPSLIRKGISIEKSNIEIIHKGYDVQKNQLELKANRNLEILYKEYERTKSGYYAFQIAQSLHILNEESEAVNYFLIALQDNSLRNEYKAAAMRSIAVHLMGQQDLERAKEYIEKSIKYDPYQPLSFLAAARIYTSLNDSAKAVASIKHAHKLNKDQVLTSQNILVDEFTILYFGMITAVKFNESNALNYFLGLFEKLTSVLKISSKQLELDLIKKVLSEEKLSEEEGESLISLLNKDNLELFITLLKKNNQTIFYHLLEKAVNKFPDSSYLLKEYSLVLTDKKQYEKAESVLTKVIGTSKDDLQAIMYLISVYLQTSQLNKLLTLLENSKQLLAANPLLAEKLNSLLQKVMKN